MSIATSKIRLSPKVRLRFDRRTGYDMLLYPETGLELNKTAMEIARLCTGEWTIDEIARHLALIYVGVPPEEIKRQVHDFLDALAGHGLLQDLP
ncbi:MAG TPA: pyrroloquinoline quinone biosynthesis peptide chaperone PqqD [Nitrospiraceae bacterium]|nr:pyrroloquinoline quinone biosynthesis peptide chaperone PqqD [Nitrospiraceae bacterium]